VAAIIAAGAAAMALPPPRAQASSGGAVSIAIDSISPRYARPGSTIVVTGTVSNGTSTALAGLNVRLFSSSAWFTSRGLMDGYMAGTSTPLLAAEGDPDVVTSTVHPGGTVTWRAQFSAAVAGLANFGVYPLQVGVTDMNGDPIAAEKTLLPFYPASRAGIAKLKIAWVWPLIDAPHHQACAALTGSDLNQSLAVGGRLHTLAGVAAANPQADVTWAIDPALLADATTMTRPYQVGAGESWRPGNCTGAVSEPASSAAASWLAAVKSGTSGQPVVITPYGNTDVAALAHQGLNSDLKSAYRLGEQVAREVLGRTFSPNMALPAAGLADQSVLTTLSATEHVTSVVLSSKEMPPADNTLAADDAVSSLRTGAGDPMNVLLADDSLTNLLRSASGATSPGAQFALEQRFLAETAMIASEFPNVARSVVVSPPETWGPSAALAQALLQESTAAPWLQPTTLSSLAGSHDAEKRKNPPATSYSPRELSKGYLTTIRTAGTRLGVFKSMLYQASPAYTTGLDEAVAAAESSAWRGNTAQGQTLTGGLLAYLKQAQGRVQIITSAEITMAGASGVLPVSIQNGLKQQNVQVKLTAEPISPGDPTTLQVGRLDDHVITIPAGATVVEKIHVSSAPSGTTLIRLQLTSKDGTQLPHSDAMLTVHSTRYGQAILILIGGAIGLLVLSSLFRAGRRWLRAPGNVGGDPTVITERAEESTEAPDELADARRSDDT